MRVALAALESRAGEPQRNLRGLRDAMRDHAGWGVDLIVVGEAFAQGFETLTDDPDHDVALGWASDGPEMETVRSWAARYGMAVCLPYLERSILGQHSSALIVDRQGRTVVNYRRMSTGWQNPASPSADYVAGVAPVSFLLADKRCTVALSGDLVDLPHVFAAQKPDVVLWPIWRDLTPEQCDGDQLAAYGRQANHVYAHALLVNPIGDGACGGAAWFRNGKVKAALPMDGVPAVLVVDL